MRNRGQLEGSQHQNILKEVLKEEIHFLLKRLATVGEETLVFTASLRDGGLGHIGSLLGDKFASARRLDIIKNDFLSFCKEEHIEHQSTSTLHADQDDELENTFSADSAYHSRGRLVLKQEPDEEQSPSTVLNTEEEHRRRKTHLLNQCVDDKTTNDNLLYSSVCDSADKSETVSVSLQRKFDNNIHSGNTTVSAGGRGADTVENITSSSIDSYTNKQNWMSREKFSGYSIHTNTGEGYNPNIGKRRNTVDSDSRYSRTGETEHSDFICLSSEEEDSVDINPSLIGAPTQESAHESYKYVWRSGQESQSINLNVNHSVSMDTERYDNSFNSGMFEDASSEFVPGVSSDLNFPARNIDSHNNMNYSMKNIDRNFVVSPDGLPRSRIIQKGNLQNHLPNDKALKPFSCKFCGRPFADSSNLRRHIQTHTRERPYQCQGCQKKFQRRAQLTIHINTKCPLKWENQ